MTVRRTNGFTLIEMLTVIVIIGIMLAATLPAVNNLMKSSGLSVASRHVSNTLGLARQYAITQRTTTRVVFPYSDTTGTGLNQAPAYQSYAVIAKANTTAGWTYIGKWEFLPIGVVFLQTLLPAGSGALDDSLNRQANLPFPDTTSGNVGQLAYIEFNPTGVATPSTAGTVTPCVLAITEGLMNGGTPTPTSKNGATLANVTTITVDPLVGRIQVVRP